MTDMDGLAAHPDLAGASAAMREEWRAEQDAAAADAAEQWRHRRTLADRFVEHMHAGDRVAVTVGGHRVTGIPEEAGADLVALRTVFGRVELHIAPGIPLTYEIYEPSAASGGRGNAIAGGQFRNALLHHEHDTEVSVGTLTEPDGLDGRIEVGVDHVKVIARAGRETVVTLDTITWVSPRRT
ncbi:MAG TPA: hypothetical protein VFX21_13315 [Acidimicrobiia bacterium]|nr:hypothetical protein [Acidimicrobiia bacterium]